MKKLSLLAVLLGFNIALGACSDDETPDVKNELFQLPEKAYVLAEQSRRAIVIRDAVTQHNIWSWDPYTACVPAAQQGWFVNPSEVKPVFNRRYILMTASGGAVALIRISDHKLNVLRKLRTEPSLCRDIAGWKYCDGRVKIR